MTTWRYKIYLLVLKNIIHALDYCILSSKIFFNTRAEILYLHVAM